jgi:tRNA-Thr(GGU) m(6)t(6)A37 methyltransferase TsaA
VDVTFTPIGTVRTGAEHVPRHWSVSDVEGTLEIDPAYRRGMKDIRPGERIVVLFHFHRSPPFSDAYLVGTPPNRDEPMGVFSICSPRRPNAIGLSVVEVIGVEGTRIDVRGIDMLDGTPILDIKPHITAEHDCPSAGRE